MHTKITTGLKTVVYNIYTKFELDRGNRLDAIVFTSTYIHTHIITHTHTHTHTHTYIHTHIHTYITVKIA